MLYVGLLDSEAFEQLSDAAQCFFVRLLLASDDAGRCDGRASKLHAACYSVSRRRKIGEVAGLIAECVEARLIVVYEWQGKPYIQIGKVRKYGGSTRSKFPWRDGSYAIEFIDFEFTDGPKQVVRTSIFDPLLSGSIPPAEGVGRGSGRVLSPPLEDVDVNEDGDVDGKSNGDAVEVEVEKSKKEITSSLRAGQENAELSGKDKQAAVLPLKPKLLKPTSTDGGRKTARSIHWPKAYYPLMSPEASQRRADDTSAKQLFDDWIWPEGSPAEEGNRRLQFAIESAKKSSGSGNRMAWLTTVIHNEFSQKAAVR